MVVAAGNQRCPRRRAKRRGVELYVAQPGLGNAILVWCRDDTAEGAGHAVPLVIRHDEKDVGGPLGRHDARRPPGRGILSDFLDDSAEFRWWWRDLLPVNRRRGARRTRRAGDLLGGGRSNRCCEKYKRDYNWFQQKASCPGCFRACHVCLFLSVVVIRNQSLNSRAHPRAMR